MTRHQFQQSPLRVYRNTELVHSDDYLTTFSQLHQVHVITWDVYGVHLYTDYVVIFFAIFIIIIIGGKLNDRRE